MLVVDAPVGAVLADMLSPVSAPVAFALYGFILPNTRTRLTGLIRYVENLTPAELAGILATGLGCALVGESRANGWVPSAALGIQDSARVVSKLRALGIPHAMVMWCDLEGVGGTSQELISYCVAWCQGVLTAGYVPGAYVGDGVPLNPMQLYALPFVRYWHSLSNVQQVAGADYCMHQLFPTQTLQLPTGPFAVDLNVVQEDKRISGGHGRLPTMLIDNGFGA